MLVRGTTPYHSFILPFTKEQIVVAYITYLQNNKIILEKTADDIVFENLVDLVDEYLTPDELTKAEQASCVVRTHLSQEDTLKFHFHPAAENNIAVIQIRLVTTDDEAYSSLPMRERIMGVLKNGVIDDE